MDNIHGWMIVLMLSGGALLLWKDKRKYSRRNVYGVPEFQSYWQKLRAEAFDNALAGLGYISILSGLFILLVTDQSIAGWVALAAFVVTIRAIRQKRNTG